MKKIFCLFLLVSSLAFGYSCKGSSALDVAILERAPYVINRIRVAIETENTSQALWYKSDIKEMQDCVKHILRYHRSDLDSTTLALAKKLDSDFEMILALLAIVEN